MKDEWKNAWKDIASLGEDREMGISMFPQWMDKLMTVCKFFLYIVPFLCCSIAMLVEGTSTSHSYVLTAVYCLSLLKLIELTDK